MHHPQLPLGNPFVGLPPNVSLSADAYIADQVFGRRVTSSVGGAASFIVANEATDTTCFPVFVTAATGDLAPKTNSNLAFNSNTGLMSFGGGTRQTGGAAPDVTVTQSYQFVTSGVPQEGMVDSTRTANNRIVGTGFSAGIWQLRFINDAFSSTTVIMTATGGQAAGITSITFPSATTVSITNALSVGYVSSSLSVRGTTAPSAATGQMYLWMNSTSPACTWVDSTQSANNRIFDTVFTSGTLAYRVVNDAFAAATNYMRVTGGHGAGISLIDFANSTANVFGHTASLTVGNAGKLQVSGNSAAASQFQASGFAADATTSGSIALSKSRSGTTGTNTIVQSGDVLGKITGYGADGTNYDAAAEIRFEVDGTPGAGTDMPGRIIFATSTDGTATLTEALRINNAQTLIPAGQVQSKDYTQAFLLMGG